MKYWLYSLSEENWTLLKKFKIWGIRNGKSIKPSINDFLIFYVGNTDYFKGIFKIISEWYETDTNPWDPPSYEVKYPLQCNLHEIQIGNSSYTKLKSKKLCKFINKEAGKGMSLKPQGIGKPAAYGKPISLNDFNVIYYDMES